MTAVAISAVQKALRILADQPPCYHAGEAFCMIASMSDVSRILISIEAGERQATSELLPLVYNELRRLAAAQLAHEKPGQSLNATALVHEAYLRLVGDEDAANWDNRRHFVAAAATEIRRILVERARLNHSGALKRRRVDLDALPNESSDEDILHLHANGTNLRNRSPFQDSSRLAHQQTRGKDNQRDDKQRIGKP